MAKITITDHAQVVHDVTAYYDFKAHPYSCNETYDPSRGRQKTATVYLYKINSGLLVPQEDNVIKIYSEIGNHIVFGGVISVIDRTVLGSDGTNWIVNYQIQASGFDPTTLDYHEVVNYTRIGIESGQVLIDLLSAYAPWVNTSAIGGSGPTPIIQSISITRKRLSDVITDIVQKTGYSFFIDDNGYAIFNDPVNLPLDWSLTEGTKPNWFPEFDHDTLKIEKNVQETVNDITLLGGPGKGAKFVETFVFNLQDGSRGLSAIPYGFDKVIQFNDNLDQSSIDQGRWFVSDPGVKLSESVGRLQVNPAVNNTGILVTKALFSRSDNIEFRLGEFEVYSFASGNAIVGIHNGTHTAAVANFLHGIQFNQAAGHIQTREGSTVTDFAGMPIGVGIYSVRIRIKATGGAIYFIQGGRTGTPKEYGLLGSKTWTRITETGTDTTPFLAAAIYATGVIGCTVIRAKISTDINVSVRLLAGGQLGPKGTPVASDTLLLCGVQGALDFETDCYIDVSNSNPTINFFTDNLPLGQVVVDYWGVDDQIRERVYWSAAKTSVIARSALPGDDGSRTTTTKKITEITDSQDARNQISKWLANVTQYRGSFETDSWRLDQVGTTKPYAGALLTVNLPNTWGFASFNEVITSVTTDDLGTNDCKYTIQFGEGNISFDRLLGKIRDKALITITDDDLAAVDADSEDYTTAGTARIATPEYVSSLFDGSGITIHWLANGAANYELRDNLYKGQGQGGTPIYQFSGATVFSIASGSITRRAYTFYIWAVTAGGQYSKNPLAITVENPAPEPRPIQDAFIIDGTTAEVRFSPEVETDILTNGRHIQIATDRAFSALVVDSDYPKADQKEDLTGLTVNTTYYFRYGLKDSYTVALGDILYSGTRELTAGASNLTHTAQYNNNVGADNDPVSISVRRIDNTATEGALSGWWVEVNFSYTQGTNIASDIVFVIRVQESSIAGGLQYADNSIMLAAPGNTTLTKYRINIKGLKLTDYILIGCYAQFTASSGDLRRSIQTFANNVQVSSLTSGTDGTVTPVIQGQFFNTYAFNSFAQTAQYRNNVAPTNAPSGVGASTAVSGYSPGAMTTITWSYAQGSNVATHFGIIVKAGGGTPTFSDQFFIVESTKLAYTLYLPVMSLISFGVFAFAVTQSGITRNTTIAVLTSVNTLDVDLQLIENSGKKVTLGGGTNINLLSTIIPTTPNTLKIGSSSGDQLKELWSQTIYRNGTSIDALFALLGSNNVFTGANDFTGGKIQIRQLSQDTQPTTTDVAGYEIIFWHDTTVGHGDPVYLLANFQGSIFKVQIT